VDHLALVQHDRAAAQLGNQIERMGDEQDRAALLTCGELRSTI
jgi:hypothetical protein